MSPFMIVSIVTIIMVENVISYSIVLFFSLVSLGATWEKRLHLMKAKIAFVMIAPVIGIMFFFLAPQTMGIFDIRMQFHWYDSYNAAYSKAAILIFFIPNFLVGLYIWAILNVMAYLINPKQHEK